MNEVTGTMRAVIMDAPGQIRVGESETPVPGPGEVLVRVVAAGICAGDIHIYNGRNPYTLYPCIGGYEIAGTVAGVGEGMSGWAEGERVVVEPFLPCGHCYPCHVGKPNCCANLSILGVHRPGGYARWLTAPANRLHRVPDNLSLSWASLAEPIAIAVQACRRAAITPGELVFVLGCGPIGLAVIEVATAHGARVVVTDVSPSRLEVARQLGAETRLADETLSEWALARTDGEGVPVVIEASGVPDVMTQAAELVAPGGRIVLLGLIPKGMNICFPELDITREEMTILGSWASAGYFPEALELLASGRITYAKAITELSLWDAPRIFPELSVNPDLSHKGVLIP